MLHPFTREELEELMRSKKSTSPNATMFRGQSGGTRYLLWCFTESGIYMLMTVLRGDLATQQSLDSSYSRHERLHYRASGFNRQVRVHLAKT